jgi:small subunit ribosomal protein S29
MLLRRFPAIVRSTRPFSAAVAEQKLQLDEFRTLENDPRKQSLQNSSKFYQIKPETKKQLFSYGGFPKSFEKQVKTFGETCIMVREPALEIINYINNTDFAKPTVRYVLYGENGVGKTLTLAHLVHYGYVNEFVLVHVPYVPYWFKHPKESGASSSKEGLIDLPLDAAAWLLHFKAQNSELLSKLDLKVSQDYVWSKRETTPAGSKMIELVEHGINRVKFASDAIEALLSELKVQSTQGKLKTMVLIDGYNSFFYPKTKIFGDHKVMIPPEKITLTKPFIDITNYDWCNGVCVLTVDQLGMLGIEERSSLPRFLLGKEGFEHLDPFVPIKIENYNEKEFETCINYYVNRRWIQNVEPGFDKELKFLSDCNPYRLMDVCKSL